MSDISIPNFRFKKYTSNLVKTKLSKIATFNPKSLLPENFKYIDLESVLGTELVSCREETRETAPSRAQRVAQKGDVFYQLVRPYQKNNYLFDLNENNYVFSTGYAQLRPKVDSAFLLARLQEEGFVNKVIERCTGTSYPAINSKDLSKISITIPEDLEEQSAIGSLFRTLDDLLASYKDNLANYQSLKATMLSKMFPKAGQTVPEIRLDGFEGEWENIRLGDCAIIKGRLGWKSLKQEEYTEVGPSMIAGKHIKNGVIDWGEVDHIPQWRYDESPDIMLENGDIIFSKDGSLGNPALVSNLKGEATINSTMMLVRLEKKVSSQFFYQVLTSSVFQKLIYLKVSGSSIPHLFQADMQDFRFFAPCIEEQQAIGTYFYNLDSLISAHQEKILQLETLKKKLLQDMFI